MAEIPPEVIADQMAHKNQFSGDGLNGFVIFGNCMITVFLILRLASRKYVQKIGWFTDDYVLIAAWLLTICSTMIFAILVEKNALGRHFLPQTPATQTSFGKWEYAYNILYIGYPLSKISLTILYQRIFSLTMRWFDLCCKSLIAAFAAYAISTTIINIWLTVPINAYWDHSVKPRRAVNETTLYKANAYFNIITDCILFVLPLTVIWRLKMNTARKVGLTFIFAIGCLTIVASIMRLVYFFQVSNLDPTYTLTPIAFTTAAEQFLGIICPSLPTLAPIIRVTWEITSSLGSARSKPTSNYSDSKMAPPDKWAQSNNGGRSRKGSSASWWRRGSAKRAPDESDETLAKKASGEALFFNGQPFTNEHQTITSKRLDPRFADLEMGTTTDAVRSISGDETLDDGESGKHGFEGLPSGAIGVKQGFKVEDK